MRKILPIKYENIIILNEEQKRKISTFKVGNIVGLKGKCEGVG